MEKQGRVRWLCKLFAIVLAVFGFFVIAPSFAYATDWCRDEVGLKNADFSCDINYSDLGGSDLTTCQYRLYNSTSGYDTGWLSAGACNGSGQILPVTITVGAAPKNCRDNGTDTCKLYGRAIDSAGNIFETPDASPINAFDINYNTAPTISNIADQTINEDANTGALAFTIGDAETAPSSLILTKASSNTTLVPTANIVFGGSGASRTVTVTPAENQSGTANITVTVSDGSLTASDTFILTVTPVNDAPVNTIPGAQTVNEDTDLAFSGTISVSDVDNTTETVTLTAANGVITLSGTSGLTFTTGDGTNDATMTFSGSITNINAALNGMKFRGTYNYNGTAASVQIVTNDGIASDTDTVAITVTAVNDAPTLTSVNALTGATEDTTFTISYTALAGAANEADVDGDTLSFRVEAVSTGSLTKNGVAVVAGTTLLASRESLVWTPAVNANGTLGAFTVKAYDGALASAAAVQVQVIVGAVNDAPTLNAIVDPAAINEDSGLQTVSLSGISAGGGESQTLTVTATSGATSIIPNPTVTYTSPNTTGSLSYTPIANANGNAVITVTVRDAGLNGVSGDADDGSLSRTFTVRITPMNDTPAASNGTLTTSEDTAGTGTLSASDIDGNPLTYSIVTNGTKGTASITNFSTGAYTYTPNANQNGTDSFTFKANDGTVDSNTATVSVTITAVNDAPVAVGESYSMYEGTTLTRNAAAGVLANDSDVEGSVLTAAVVGIPANGSLTLNANGSFVYTPVASFNGNDSFTYKANDGAADSNTATVTITVSDGTAPTITSFTINGTACSGESGPNSCNNQINVNSTFTIAWTASESGGSYLGNAKIYRAVFASGQGKCHNTDKSLCSWELVGSTISAPATSNSWSSSTTDNPMDDTYWYGIHIADNAQNCIDEDAGDTDKGHCGGVNSDGLDTRTDRGPIKIRMQHNSAPTIQGNVGITPAPPVKAGVQLTFSVDWNDPGDQVKIHICKDVLAVSGASCNAQGSWCASSDFTTNDPTICSYTTLVTDGGTKAYNAYVCDDEGACSEAKSGNFLVDTQAPTISSFTRTPVPPAWISNASANAVVSWSVLDQGGSNLKRIEIWRAWDKNGNHILETDPDGNGNTADSEWNNPGNEQANPLCTKTGGPPKCTGDQNFDSASTDADSYTDTGIANSADYWYGLHVLDVAENMIMTTEGAALKVQADKDNPTSQIQSPASGASKGSSFTVTVADVDTGGSTRDDAQCKYSVLYDDGSCAAGPCKSAVSNAERTCGAATPSIRTTDQCSFEGVNACRVIVKSKDIAGNNNGLSEAQNSIRDFSIDLTWPVVDRVSCTADLNAPCTQVQRGVSTVFNARVSDNIQLANCEFLWRQTGTSNPWQNMSGAVGFTSIACEGAHTGDCFKTSASHTFETAGTYDVRAQCWDGASHTMPGDFVPVTAHTLSAVLDAIPPSGSINTLFDLVATVSGTMTGNAGFKFDCNVEQNPAWNFTVNNIDLSVSDSDWVIRQGKQTKVEYHPYDAGPPVQEAYSTFAVQDLCQYSPPATYTAKVFVERGVGTAEDTVNIQVSANSLPNATNLQHNNATADYCFVSSPPIILSWQFSDQDLGDSQSAYRVQIANNPGFNSPIDTCPPPQGEAGGTCVVGNEAQAYAPPGLVYATTYYWRVKVWDTPGDASSWVTGPSLTTPAHSYPVPSLSKAPDSPGAQELVQFTDQTNFATGSTGKTWSWDFDSSNGIQADSTQQNPSHTYSQTGVFEVTLRSGDDVGACSSSQNVNISIPFPEWQEISPF